jgi:hypothetical protein
VAARYYSGGRWCPAGGYHCCVAVWILRLTLCELHNVLNAAERPSATSSGSVLLQLLLRLEAAPAGALL